MRLHKNDSRSPDAWADDNRRNIQQNIILNPTLNEQSNKNILTRGSGLRDKDTSSNYLPWRIPMIDGFNKWLETSMVVERVFGI